MSQIVDLTTESFYENPWPTYAYMRKTQPIYWAPNSHTYYLFKHKHVRQVLLNPKFSVEHPFRATRQIFGPTLLDLDGASHHRIRSMAMTSFRPSAVENYATAIIEPVVRDVIDEMLKLPNPDFIANFAVPIPFRIICRILGIPEDRAIWIYDQMRPIVSYLDMQRPGGLTSALVVRNELSSYLAKIVEAHKVDVKNTLIGSLVQVHQSDARIDDAEMMRTAFLMIAAGTETSMSSIGNLFVCLLNHPNMLEAIQKDPKLIPAIVRETLRWEPPVTSALRFAKEDIAIGDIIIKRGTALQLSLASANRDEDVFSDPEKWNPHRSENDFLSFGAGRHTCLGFILAQRELEIVLQCLFERIHILSSKEDEIPKIQGHLFRGLSSLRLNFKTL